MICLCIKKMREKKKSKLNAVELYVNGNPDNGSLETPFVLCQLKTVRLCFIISVPFVSAQHWYVTQLNLPVQSAM